MYQKPDFVKVSLKVSDVFANYVTTGCPEDHYGMWTNTYPCEGVGDYESKTLTQMGLAHQCYNSDQP